jgi:uncharacterized protein involved in exopolysaccharide biosynthesis
VEWYDHERKYPPLRSVADSSQVSGRGEDSRDAAGGDRANPGKGTPSGDAEISMLQLMSVLLKRRYTVILSTFGVAVLVVAYTLLTFEARYTSRSSFIPQAAGRGGVDGLEVVAGQLGIRVPTEGGSESPQFYAELLRSQEILRHLLVDTFTVNHARGGEAGVRSGTLLDLLQVEVENEGLRHEAGLRWLGNVVSASVSRETSVVSFTVTTPWPNVSRDIAARLLELVNEFNLRTRQSQAAAERAFVEERLVEARKELTGAEDELKRFLENNRQFRNSPDLLFEHDRLQRQVSTRQQVFTSLSQSYEQSRIAQVRDTPLITVVEPPREPVSRNPRGLARRGLMGIVLGGIIGIFIAFGREVMDRSRADGGPGYQAFHEVWADTLDDVRRILRRFPGRAGS